MKRVLLCALLFAACEEDDSLKGHLVYGTFTLSAKRASDDCGLGGGESFSSTVTLSASPPRFYMRVGGVDREGTIAGPTFTIDPPAVPQTIEHCTCPAGHPGTYIQERIEANLHYAGFDGGFPDDAGFAPADPDGGLLPEGFDGGLVDTVSQPREGCSCADAGPLPCQVKYTITGLRQ